MKATEQVKQPKRPTPAQRALAALERAVEQYNQSASAVRSVPCLAAQEVSHAA